MTDHHLFKARQNSLPLKFVAKLFHQGLSNFTKELLYSTGKTGRVNANVQCGHTRFNHRSNHALLFLVIK